MFILYSLPIINYLVVVIQLSSADYRVEMAKRGRRGWMESTELLDRWACLAKR